MDNIRISTPDSRNEGVSDTILGLDNIDDLVDEKEVQSDILDGQDKDIA